MRLKVPIEVAEKIIDEHASAEDVLRQCALVCHDWLPRSRVHLFRRVVIRKKAQMDSLRRTLQTSPDIGNLIRAVCVRSDVGKFARRPLVGSDNLVPMALAVLLPSLQLHSSLETLHLDDIAYYSYSTSTPGGRIYRGCLSQYRSVRTLYLQSFEFHSHTQMIPFLSALPHLRRLVLHDLDFRCVNLLGEHLPSPPHAKLKLIPLTSIEMVGTIPGCMFRALWEVTHPTLEHLAMDSAPNPRLEAGRTWDLIRYPRLQKLSITESLSQQGNYWDAVDFAATLLENPLPELRVLRFDIQTELPDCPMAFLPSKNARSARAFKAIDSFVISQEHSGHPLAPQIIFVLPKVRGHVARDWTVVIQDSFSPMVRMHALHIENAPGRSHHVDGHRNVVQQLSFSPDGRYIASVERRSDYPSVILWDVRSGAIKNYWGHPKRFSSPPSFAFSPNGQHIALYDFPKGTLEVHECNANSGSSKIWGVQQAYEGDATWPAPPDVIWTAKNTVVICHTRFAAASFAIHSYHAEDGMRPSVGGVELRPYASTTFRRPVDEGRLPEISPSGQLFLYRKQGEKGIVVDRRILDKSLGKQKLRCPEASLDASASHRLWFLQFIGRSDQEIVTALCWTCRSVLSWELARAERARHPPARVEVAKGTIAGEVYDSSVVPVLSQNGEVVAWRAPDPSPGQSCAIVACGTSPNRQLRSLQMPGMSASYIRWRPPLVLSPDGSLLADFQSKEVLLWRTRDGLRVASIQNHPSVITELAFSANGEVIATGAADGMVRIYHLKDIIANNCATAASGVAEDGGHASVDGEHASTVGSVKGKEDMGAL